MNENEYKKLKEQLSKKYKNYDLAEILSLDLIQIVFGVKRSLLSAIYQSLFCKKIDLPKKQKNKILFSMGDYAGRKDYYEILNYVKNDIEHDFIDVFHSGKKIHLRFVLNFIFSLSFLFKSKLEIKLIDKVILYFRVVHIKNTIDYLEKQHASYEKVCTFCSAHAYEAIVDNYFRKRNTTTYTLQHGVYFQFKKPVVDQIAYENMISDHLLCWGDFTKNELVKYGIPSEKLLVSGYPRKSISLRPYKIDKEELKILFLCSRLKYDDKNKVIMNILHEYARLSNSKVIVKTHPALNQSEYKALADEFGFEFSEDETIQELIVHGGFDFSIAYNSTAYIDSYINNLISFHYQDVDRENDAEVLGDSFSNAEELSLKIQKFIPKADKVEVWDEVLRRLNYLVGFEINRYKEYLNDK